MMIQSGMHGRSINECRSNDCRSNDCRSYECRRNNCRSYDCRSNETTPQQIAGYFTKLIKQIQHLPERTANVASLLLVGQLPIEPEIHRRMINLFGNIIRNFESIERDIAIRQLATKPKTSDSWFIEIVKLLELYELPCIAS